MKKPLGRLTIVLLVIFSLSYLLLSLEWPVPEWARSLINSQLKKESLTLNYTLARFDLMGNVRVTGAYGSYEGLAEFSAKQILLRPFALGGIELTVDSGELHTGFLQLPIPESIRFSGTLQKRHTRVIFKSLKLNAGSLVVLVRGSLSMPSKNQSNSARSISVPVFSVAAQEKDQKLLAGFLTKLCNDTSAWVAQVDLAPAQTTLTIAGQTIHAGAVTIKSPVLSVRYPLSGLSLYADEVSSPQGRATGVSLNYNANEGALWRAMVTSLSVEGINLNSLSASARYVLSAAPSLAEIKDFSAATQLENGGSALIDQCSFSPLSVRLFGRLSPALLPKVGLKIQTATPGVFYGKLQEDLLRFSYYGANGEFYAMPFDTATARGTLSKSSVLVDHFELTQGLSHASGALVYNPVTKAAHYDLVGEVDPRVIPWFGDWWEKIFKPFGRIYPQVALELDSDPNKPMSAHGTAVAESHSYKTVHLDKTLVGISAGDHKADVTFLVSAGAENLRGQMQMGENFSGTFSGDVYPKTLAAVYFDTPPAALESLEFAAPPRIQAKLGGGNTALSLSTDKIVRYYAMTFNGLSTDFAYDGQELRVNNLQFGFAEGKGGGRAQVNTSGAGYGSFWIRDANLGEWSLLGPLSNMLRTRWLAFTSLRFHSADGNLVFEPGRVSIPLLNIWGNDHAAVANGAIDTQQQTVDFSVKLKTLGGNKPLLGVLAPVIQPFTSVLEARLSGPLKSPQWHMQLVAPSLLAP